jgi:putative ABC transport system permease protein
MLKQALRMLWRDWRAGEVGFLLVAIMIAVAALSSVSFFAERIRSGLQRDSNQMLGADLVIGADRPIPQAWREVAQQQGLKLAETVVFSSMALNPDGMSKLVSLKAVSPAYPLRGSLKTSNQAGGEGTPTREVPAPGTVWADSNLFTALNLKLGQKIQIGEKSFVLSQMIASEPDRGASFMNFAPRAMIALSDLPATELVQPGSRITYRLLVADQRRILSTDSAELGAFQSWLKTQIAGKDWRGVNVESLESARPETRATLDRAERFLALVSLLSSLLAAVAIALAARRYMLRHLNACVMLRFLGLTQNQATRMFLFEFIALGLIGSGLGALLGFAAHFLLLALLGPLVGAALPPPSPLPAWQAFVTGLILLIGFALPPLLQLRNATLNRVLRREPEAPKALTLLSYVFGATGFVGLLIWQAGEVKLGLMIAGGFFAGLVVFSLVAWLSLFSVRLLKYRANYAAWRFALASLQRRPAATAVQIVALALGLMALLLLTVVRGQLVDAWRSSAPADAPNRFMINIQPDQKAAIEARLQERGVNNAPLFPMIRGRLISINERLTSAEPYRSHPDKRLLEREFNLSTLPDLPEQNFITQGRWYAPDAVAEASVEQGLAETFNLKLGDKLRFDIAGQIVEAKMTSIRKLDWGSMRVNFYVIINPKAMEGMPQSFISAFHLPPEKAAVGDQLAKEFPNLSVVDTGQILRQVQAILDQVIAAVEFLFLFTLAAGGLVLYAVLLGSQDERKREAGLMRALGATRKQLAGAQRIEFLFIGALAGGLAATGAVATGWGLAVFVFQFSWRWQPEAWLAGITAGVVVAMIGGWLGLRGVLQHPPLQTLREAV